MADAELKPIGLGSSEIVAELESLNKRIDAVLVEKLKDKTYKDLGLLSSELKKIGDAILQLKVESSWSTSGKVKDVSATVIKKYNEAVKDVSSMKDDIDKEKIKILGELNKAKELSKTVDSKTNIEEFTNQLKDIGLYTLETLTLLGKSISGNIEAKAENVKAFITLLSLYSFAKQKIDSLDKSIIERDTVLNSAKTTMDRFFLEQNSMANDAQKLTDYKTRYDKEVDPALKSIPGALDMQTRYKELIRQSDQMKAMTARMNDVQKSKPEYADMFVLFSYADANREYPTRDNYIVLQKMSERARNDYNTFIKDLSAGNQLEEFNKLSTSAKVSATIMNKAPMNANLADAVKDLPQWMQKETISLFNKKDPKEIIGAVTSFEQELNEAKKDGYLSKLKDMLYVLEKQANKSEVVLGNKTVQNIIDELNSAINGTDIARRIEVYNAYKDFTPLTVVEQYKYNSKDVPNAPRFDDIKKSNIDAVRFMSQSVAYKNEVDKLKDDYDKARTDKEKARINQEIENKRKVYDNTIKTVDARIKYTEKFGAEPSPEVQAKKEEDRRKMMQEYYSRYGIEKNKLEEAKRQAEQLRTGIIPSSSMSEDAKFQADKQKELASKNIISQEVTPSWDDMTKADAQEKIAEILSLTTDEMNQDAEFLKLISQLNNYYVAKDINNFLRMYRIIKKYMEDFANKEENKNIEQPSQLVVEQANKLVNDLVGLRIGKDIVLTIKINQAITDIIKMAKENDLTGMNKAYEDIVLLLNNTEAQQSKQELPVQVNKETTQTV
jgi:hypothetical protein